MKLAELVKISRPAMKVMSECDIRMNDWQYLSLYEDYCEMRKRMEKFRYVIAVLAERYQVSESTIKRVVRRLGEEANI